MIGMKMENLDNRIVFLKLNFKINDFALGEI